MTAADALAILRDAVGLPSDPKCPAPGAAGVATTEEPTTSLPEQE